MRKLVVFAAWCSFFATIAFGIQSGLEVERRCAVDRETALTAAVAWHDKVAAAIGVTPQNSAATALDMRSKPDAAISGWRYVQPFTSVPFILSLLGFLTCLSKLHSMPRRVPAYGVVVSTWRRG